MKTPAAPDIQDPETWGMDPKDMEILSEIISTGNMKLAARNLDLSHWTVRTRLLRLRLKFKRKPELLTLYLSYDRYLQKLYA